MLIPSQIVHRGVRTHTSADYAEKQRAAVAPVLTTLARSLTVINGHLFQTKNMVDIKVVDKLL